MCQIYHSGSCCFIILDLSSFLDQLLVGLHCTKILRQNIGAILAHNVTWRPYPFLTKSNPPPTRLRPFSDQSQKCLKHIINVSTWKMRQNVPLFGPFFLHISGMIGMIQKGVSNMMGRNQGGKLCKMDLILGAMCCMMGLMQGSVFSVTVVVSLCLSLSFSLHFQVT